MDYKKLSKVADSKIQDSEDLLKLVNDLTSNIEWKDKDQKPKRDGDGVRFSLNFYQHTRDEENLIKKKLKSLKDKYDVSSEFSFIASETRYLINPKTEEKEDYTDLHEFLLDVAWDGDKGYNFMVDDDEYQCWAEDDDMLSWSIENVSKDEGIDYGSGETEDGDFDYDYDSQSEMESALEEHLKSLYGKDYMKHVHPIKRD